MSERDWDVIVVGGSFAGLSTAYFLRDADTLVLERKRELGMAQRSTCCTSLEWMRRLRCEEAVLQRFSHLTLHAGDGVEAKVKLPQIFCTIDYKRFCEELADRLGKAEVLCGEKVTGVRRSGSSFEVVTRRERYKGKIVVDASGWPGLEARSVGSKTKPAFGLEVETAFDGDPESFHIYYGKRYIRGGYGWAFPTSERSARFGVGGFTIDRPLQSLDRFLWELGLRRDGLRAHGGYLPLWGLQEPVSRGVFKVGDSCGQVLPTSGEGIRKAFEYSEICGQVIQKVLHGAMTLEEGLRLYGEEVRRDRRFYDNMRFVQTLAVYCPEWARRRLIKTLSNIDGARATRLLQRYLAGDIKTSKTRILKTVIGGVIG